ncbi:cytochrome b [Oceaniglobus roseus]|uniref:cytochrome b n=1 Tax=Oceaniglobus roseus TaxID=1737570 RepID=UPI0012FFE5F5|nr:cytochrome b/b6 domain-containing protein [Kandeliimicrobium roseum]
MAERTTYTHGQIALHWLIALLVLGNYIFSDGMGRALHQHDKGETVTGLLPWAHVYVGIAILVLVLVRFALRKTRGVPPESAQAPELLRKGGRIGHWLLYLLMLAVPALGISAWYLGIHEAGDIHALAANALMILAGIHAVAALYHHYVVKDALLQRMGLPL